MLLLPPFTPTPINKQTWLDHDNVVIGTKCNRLRQVHIPTRTWHELAYPPQPVHRLGPDLLATGNRAHCGQHDLAVSPSGAFMVSGGTAAEDQVLWRLQQRQPSQEQEQEDSSSGASSSMQLQPVQTFMGHADWVFGLDWLSDRHWVSGSRDGTVKLWQVPDAAHAPTPSPYTPEPGCPLLSVSYHAVCCKPRQVGLFWFERGLSCAVLGRSPIRLLPGYCPSHCCSPALTSMLLFPSCCCSVVVSLCCFLASCLLALVGQGACHPI